MSLKIEAVKRNNEGSVLLRFAYTNKTRRHFGTGVVIPLSDYNQKAIQRPVRSSNPNAPHLNRMVEAVYDRINDCLAKIRREDRRPTADYVYAKFNEVEEVVTINQANGPTVESFMEDFLTAMDYPFQTLKLYHITFKQFRACFGDISVSKFDVTQWNKFKEYLFDNKCKSVNTVCIRLSKLKCFLNFLHENRGIDLPLKDFKIPIEEIKKVSLDFHSLKQITEYQPETEAMNNIKDLCLFQCFTGLRISDLKRFNKNHVVKNSGKYYIVMKAYKTGVNMTIPLGDTAMEILERHKYSLPMVVEQYYNRELKSLLKLAGVDRVIEWVSTATGEKVTHTAKLSKVFTNHCCSRTAISYFFEKRFTPSEVASIVGKSLDTILKYYLTRSSSDSIMGRHSEMVSLSDKSLLASV